MRISREALRTVLAYVCAAWALNAALTFAFEPYGSKSQVIWHDYAAEEALDTVAVGTSTTARGFNPYVIDDELGAASYDLASPSQTIEESFLAIRQAYDDHRVSRVVLGLSHLSLEEGSRTSPGSVFMRNRGAYVGVCESLRAQAWVLFDRGGWTEASSLNALFPWTLNHVRARPSELAANIKNKLGHADLPAAAEALEGGWTYVGKGYGRSDATLDYDGGSLFLVDNGDGQEAAGAADFDEALIAPLDPVHVDTLDQIVSYCAERGIRLYVVGLPVPDFALMGSRGEVYFAKQQEVADLLAARGVTYYDFNMAAPQLLQVRPAHFMDSEHLNAAGSDAFSRALADLITRTEAGEDTGALFLTREQRERRLQYLSAVEVRAVTETDGIHVLVTPLAGDSVECEYQVLVREAGEDEYVIARDWSDERAFVYVPEGRGVHTILVNARVAGGGERERFQKVQALW